MNIKKMLIGGMAALLLTGIPMEEKTEAYAAGMQYEYEDNDSYETANYIALGDSVTGIIEDRDDVDYYKVSTSMNGKIELSFCHTYADESGSWVVSTYIYQDGQYTELSSQYIHLNDNEKVEIPYIGAVQNGIYYIKVVRDYSGVIEKNYSIQTSFVTSDCIEKEVNDTYAEATNVTLGNSYSGIISNANDKDYYKITAPENGKISLDFKHTYADESGSWVVSTYIYQDGQYTELSSQYIHLNDNEKVEIPYIGAVQNGIYYIKVVHNNQNVIGNNYSIQTSFKKSDYMEKEVNDVYATATNAELNHSYSGTINNGADKDYYKIIVPKDGMLDITFNHTFENSYDSWKVMVYSYCDGAYTELSNTYVNLNSNKVISLPTVWAHKNNVYYVKVECNASGVIGKNYAIKAKFSPYSPSNLRISTSKNTAKLTWSSAWAVDGYEVYCKVGKNGTYKKIATTKKTSYSYKKLAKGKTYYFKVRGYQKSGNKTYYSTYTTTKSVTRK